MLSGITSVQGVTISPDRTGSFVLFASGIVSGLIGSCCLLTLLTLLSPTSTSDSIVGAAAVSIIGIIFILLGILVIWLAFRHDRALKPNQRVVLRTAGGEIVAYQSRDFALITVLLKALNDAIVARG